VNYICEQCGVQFAESAQPPASCAICEDDRQYVRWGGQRWLTPAELASSRTVIWKEDAGVLGFSLEPEFAIGQRALLAKTPHGNILWDCISLVTDEAVAEIGRHGGLSAIAISHPHFYSAMVDWSRAFGGVPIYIHADERRWVMRPDPAIVFWSGERHPINPAATLIRCGGHFPGAQVLHWKRGDDAVLLSGDVLQVTADRRHVSFMYSFPNYIPLNAETVRAIADSLADVDFDSIYGAWWGRIVLGNARAALDASVERYLRAIA
jgi:glyoxylase-like metal-dependent hydrolase (beta-lactamase superfamily II)